MQEGEDARLHRKRAKRDLLVAEHAGDADHAAVEDGESEQRHGMARAAADCGATAAAWTSVVMGRWRNRFAANFKTGR